MTTHNESIRMAARTVGIAHARERSPSVRHRLRGRVEGLVIAAHIADGTSYTPDGIVSEAAAYVHAAVSRPELTHDEIMDAYRSGVYD